MRRNFFQSQRIVYNHKILYIERNESQLHQFLNNNFQTKTKRKNFIQKSNKQLGIYLRVFVDHFNQTQIPIFLNITSMIDKFLKMSYFLRNKGISFSILILNSLILILVV
jgi:hypothetical protein